MRIAGMGQPFALDFGAVMTFGAALNVDAEMLADVLPRAEAAIIAGIAGEAHDDIEPNQPEGE